MKKWVYLFSQKECHGDSSMRNLLGGKGANLAEMASLGLPVPPGFTISTEACTRYYTNDNKIDDAIISQTKEYLSVLEKINGLKFGDVNNPLLLSIRSGARISMPGMMDTILNVGLNDETVRGLIKKTGNEWFALDSYRRLLEMYGDVVAGIHKDEFEHILNRKKVENYVSDERELSTDTLKELIELYKKVYKKHGIEFPQKVEDQLWNSVMAVFKSWHNDRAKTYRKINKIPEDWGTAVNIQTMVFGNFGDTSATGVFFTRNPSTGEDYIFGEYLVNAQGEDVVAGTRTPAQLSIRGKEESFSSLASMEESMPDTYKQLVAMGKDLEHHYKDVQDIEFTVQDGKIWLLQTRSGKRSAKAAVKIVHDMVNEGVLTKEEALLRISPEQIEQLLHPTISKGQDNYKVITTGLPASPGAVSGAVCFDSKRAEEMAKLQRVILVRKETSPEDISGMNSSVGILTGRGGMTSHAAVVARGMGKSCIVGATQLEILENEKCMKASGYTIKEGDKITLNGSTGEVILGEIKTSLPDITGELKTILSWADGLRKLAVRANADTPQDSQMAIKFGAEGIGLCRTEHMFFNPTRIFQVRKLILSEIAQDRQKALEALFQYQKADFLDIFKAMAGLPITIRLLDPPLHEFLPHAKTEIDELAKELGLNNEQLQQRIKDLTESNPMLGHRGCRLGISHKDIYEMQVRAIMEAALESEKAPKLEIMIPLIGNLKEMEFLKQVLTDQIEEVFSRCKRHIEYMFGSMIELPKAAIVADQLAKEADFFSFGTNDLTQTTLGISRDDAGRFISVYLDKKIFEVDPFVTIDTEGVGELVKMAANRARQTKPNIKLGICGEHGGDPQSIDFFHSIDLNYVSCSPFRIPLARLAAAQANIREQKMQANC